MNEGQAHSITESLLRIADSLERLVGSSDSDPDEVGGVLGTRLEDLDHRLLQICKEVRPS